MHTTAKVRGAPLGWAFPLAFLAHGLMPLGGGIVALILMQPRGLGFAVFALAAAGSAALLTWLVRVALRARARVARFAEMEQAGTRAEAEVVEVVGLGGAGRVRKLGASTRYVRLRVVVRVPQSYGAPRRLEDVACYSMTEEAKLRVPGARVAVALHPSGDGTFLVL